MNHRDRCKYPWTLVGLIAAILIVMIVCSCGLVVFWLMLGAPWPIEPSSFFE